MASKVLVDPLDLSCSICLDEFTDPRVLPCVHTYCYGCLGGWVKKAGSRQTITCPLCKDVSPIPSGGLKRMKNNYFIADLVEQINKIELKPSHATPRNVELSEVHPIIYCKTHARNVVDQYCVDCDLAACGTCLLRNHMQHNLVDLEEQATISKQQLQSVILQTDVFIKLLNDKIQDSEKHEKQSTNDINSIKRQINKVIAGMISKLNNKKQQLFNSLDKIQAQKEKVMMTVHDGQEFANAAVTSLRSYSDSILRHGRDFDRVQQTGDIQSRLASVKTSKIPSFNWSRHDVKAASSQGDMAVAKLSVTTEVIDTKAVDQVMGSGAGSVRDNVVSKIPLIEQGLVTGLVVMNKTVWVVHARQSIVQAYPVTSPHQPQTLPIKGMSEPVNMVRFRPRQSRLVISDCGSKQLLWIKLDQRNGVWKLTSQRTVKVNYRPLDLGVRDNQLLVCSGDVIHVLSTSGEETHRVNMPQGVRAWKAVAQLTSPGFVIRDWISMQVVLVTEKGEIQHTYRDQEGFYPEDIVCHSNSIYVIDSDSNRVDELSVDGRHVRQLIREQGVRWSTRICVDDTGRLYVVQGGRGKREVWMIETTVTPTDTQATPSDRILTQQTNMNLSVTWCN